MTYRVEIDGQDCGAVVIEENHPNAQAGEYLIYMIYRLNGRIMHHLISMPAGSNTDAILNRMTELTALRLSASNTLIKLING